MTTPERLPESGISPTANRLASEEPRVTSHQPTREGAGANDGVIPSAEPSSVSGDASAPTTPGIIAFTPELREAMASVDADCRRLLFGEDSAFATIEEILALRPDQGTDIPEALRAAMFGDGYFLSHQRRLLAIALTRALAGLARRDKMIVMLDASESARMEHIAELQAESSQLRSELERVRADLDFNYKTGVQTAKADREAQYRLAQLVAPESGGEISWDALIARVADLVELRSSGSSPSGTTQSAPTPIIPATEDHPAIYREGHRLTASPRKAASDSVSPQSAPTEPL
jgi:hypothetical protein